ncbi:MULTISPECIES: ABC transporter permease [Actinoalloteichus]|uniref:ABC-type dipeptide/oligopeptide/nickel transport system, permease component n=1 Tax=Actinoalloteichus fjordicus TaxID=1612552 RepID=A0AAC9LFG8_9PSEU|nr:MULTISPECIES: ABC transporter permease [Actinoalloteichus]APU15355.1 ABC-type dipeptide/oligopeptide/nickel transport system, permease component [Actinoalloteichus fjordicus]APU21422.1 ABC-type dipeptide/oligopeptide/nickel transport system, permease component [Actinoalloteichus sp. GBA129-24]
MSHARGMPGFIGSRLCIAVVTLGILSVVVFWATEVLPGDAVGVLSGSDATEAERAAVREALGLDRPAPERYLDWVGGALRGDLGVSMVSGRPVDEILVPRLLNTLVLVVIAIVVIAAVSVTIGLLSGMRAGGPLDRVLSSATMGLIATPDFLLATLLLTVFATMLGLFPAVSLVPLGDSAWQHAELLVLPTAALVLGGLGGTTRLVRSSVISVVRSPYIENARLNGARGLHLALAHVLPNALGPGVQALAIMAAGLLGGGIVVETLFNYPGIGFELTQAVGTRDVPVVAGLSLALSTCTLMILLLGDLAARLLGGRASRGATR